MHNITQKIVQVADSKLATTYAVPEQYMVMAKRSEHILGELDAISYKPMQYYSRSPLSFFAGMSEKARDNLVDNLGCKINKLAAEYLQIQDSLGSQKEQMSERMALIRSYNLGIEARLVFLQGQKATETEAALKLAKSYEDSANRTAEYSKLFELHSNESYSGRSLQQAGLPEGYLRDEKSGSLFAFFGKPKQNFTGAEAASLFLSYAADLRSAASLERKKVNTAQESDTPLNQAIRATQQTIDRVHSRELVFRNSIYKINDLAGKAALLQDANYVAGLKTAMAARVDKGSDRFARRKYATAQTAFTVLALVGGLFYLSDRIESKISSNSDAPAIAAPLVQPSSPRQSQTRSTTAKTQPVSIDSVTNEYYSVIPGKEKSRVLLYGPKTALFTEGYIIEGRESGPTAMVIGGIHGNERASREAVEELAETLEVRSGKVILVPSLNRAAATANVRGMGVDMNRIFSDRVKNVAEGELAEAVSRLARDYNVSLVLNTHTNNTGGYGDSFVADTNDLVDIAQEVVARMNSQLGSGVAFKSMLKPMPDTATYFFAQKGVAAFGVETNDNLNLRDGIKLQEFAIKSMLEQYGIETNIDADVQAISAPAFFGSVQAVPTATVTEKTAPAKVTPLKPVEPDMSKVDKKEGNGKK